MKRMLVLFFLLSGALIFTSGSAIAAWTQAKGHAYNQLTLGFYDTTKKTSTIEKNDAGDILRTNRPPFRQEEEEFNQTSITYYGEFGLMNNFTGILSVPYNIIRSNDVMKEGNSGPQGIGDINLGVRQKISDNIGAGVLMSIELGVKIPEAYDYGDPIFEQSLGDGQYDYTAKLKFGRGFSKGYMVVDVGYKYRDYNREHDDMDFKPSDNFIVSISGGYNVASWLSIRAKTDWSKSIGNAVVSDGMIAYGHLQGVNEANDEAELILDTLGLEKSSLSAGVALAFSITSKIQTVVSYNTDLVGFGDLRTKNAGLGQTYDIALVYMY